MTGFLFFPSAPRTVLDSLLSGFGPRPDESLGSVVYVCTTYVWATYVVHTTHTKPRRASGLDIPITSHIKVGRTAVTGSLGCIRGSMYSVRSSWYEMVGVEVIPQGLQRLITGEDSELEQATPLVQEYHARGTQPF